MRRSLPVLAAASLLAGCAFTGGPLPPLANVPSKVADLAAVERGDRIIVTFTAPALTTEGMAIKRPLTLDLRIGTAGAPFNDQEWARNARREPSPATTTGAIRYEISAAEWVGKEAILAVQAIGANGKDSGWSNPVVLPVVAPPPAPADLRAEGVPTGVRLTWSGPEAAFRILRRGPSDQDFSPAATVSAHEWVDTAIEYGKPYAYTVIGLVDLGSGKTAESLPTGPAAITPADTFPPAAPTGLHAAAAPTGIELTWERNTEPDLAAYRVYRAEGDGQLAPLADVPAMPSYSDHAAQPGKTYRYAVSALDRDGNQSPLSPPVAVIFAQ